MPCLYQDALNATHTCLVLRAVLTFVTEASSDMEMQSETSSHFTDEDNGTIENMTVLNYSWTDGTKNWLLINMLHTQVKKNVTT